MTVEQALVGVFDQFLNQPGQAGHSYLGGGAGFVEGAIGDVLDGVDKATYNSSNDCFSFIAFTFPTTPTVFPLIKCLPTH